MNISLPDSLKDFVDEQVNERGYGTSSEYVRELIRKDKDRLRLRGLLLAGAESAPTKPVDEAYFDRLRRKVKSGKPGTRRCRRNQLSLVSAPSGISTKQSTTT